MDGCMHVCTYEQQPVPERREMLRQCVFLLCFALFAFCFDELEKGSWEMPGRAANHHYCLAAYILPTYMRKTNFGFGDWP